MNRIRGRHLDASAYDQCLHENVVDRHWTTTKRDGKEVKTLWHYRQKSMKGSPIWSEILQVRHLLVDLLHHSAGEGVLQSSFSTACMTYFEGDRWPKHNKEDIDCACYRLRTMISNLREYKRRRQTVPDRLNGGAGVGVGW